MKISKKPKNRSKKRRVNIKYPHPWEVTAVRLSVSRSHVVAWSYRACTCRQLQYGIFPTLTTLSVGTGPKSITSADYNNDSYIDLAVAWNNNISIYKGNGAGSFTFFLDIPEYSDPRSISSGDLNNDGNFDLVTANAGGGTVSGTESFLFSWIR
jgi:hypothetical protein